MTGGWFFDPLESCSFDLCVLDPPWPWQYWGKSDGNLKRTDEHYDLMTWQDIAAMPVRQLARKDCLLLLWATSPLIHKQIACMEIWGFKFQTAFYWQKKGSKGGDLIALGKRVRSMVEPVLVGTIGAPKHRPFPGIFPGVRRAHSQKPEEFYSLVERLCPDLTHRADIFARQRRPGWMSFGNELDKFPGEAA